MYTVTYYTVGHKGLPCRLLVPTLYYRRSVYLMIYILMYIPIFIMKIENLTIQHGLNATKVSIYKVFPKTMGLYLG